MTGTLLITNGGENGGVHPPRKWAEVSADQIIGVFDVSGAASGSFAEVRAFREEIVRILLSHVENAQHHHRRRLVGKPIDHPIDGETVEGHARNAANAIVAASKGKTFEAAFAADAVVKHLDAVLVKDLLAVAEVEHLWHRDRASGAAPDSHHAWHAAWHAKHGKGA